MKNNFLSIVRDLLNAFAVIMWDSKYLITPISLLRRKTSFWEVVVYLQLRYTYTLICQQIPHLTACIETSVLFTILSIKFNVLRWKAV